MPDLTFFLWLPILFGVLYLAIPLFVRVNQRYPATPKLLELDLHDLDAKSAQFLMTHTKTLIGLGFAEPLLVKMPDPSPSVQAFLTMLVHRTAGDKAMVMVMRSTTNEEHEAYFVEFSTSYDTGEMVDTSNCETLNAFPPGAKTVRIQTPSVKDVEELYRLHKYQTEAQVPTSRKTLFEPGQARAYLANEVLGKTFAQQVERSWLAFDAGNNCYRPTLKGAYLMTWSLLPPVSFLRLARIRRREKRILRAFRTTI